MARSTTKDLTVGVIWRQLLSFALPIFLGQVFQNLYNSVDAIVVGNAVGTTALAAVSSSSDISMLLTGFFTGFSTGAGVIIARYFGAKDREKLHNAIHTAVTLALCIGVTIAIVGVIIAPFLLKVVDCPEDVYGEALAYLRIYLIGILFTAIYNLGAGVLRAVGDSRRPFYFLVISSIVNICLDMLFVVIFRMGVQGAAFATIISQAISVTLVFSRLIMTDDIYKLTLKELRLDKELVLEIARIGLPAAIQSSLVSISNLFVQRYINGFGSSAMAGIGAAKKIDKFIGMAAQSMGLATATFVSQNVGAKKLGRAFKGIRTTLTVCFIYWLAVGTVVYTCAPIFVNIFTKDEAAVTFGVSMIHVMMPLYFLQICNNIFANSVRGFGKSFVVMLCSIFGMIGCRQIFLAISMSIVHRVENVYIGYPVGWGCAATAVITYFFLAVYLPYRKKKKAGLIEEAEE